MRGQTIGVLQGSTAVPVAKGIQGAKVLQYTTMPAAYQALLDAKVNAVINDDQDALRVAMNRALARMKQNGQYQALIKRWGLQSLAP